MSAGASILEVPAQSFLEAVQSDLKVETDVVPQPRRLRHLSYLGSTFLGSTLVSSELLFEGADS